MTSHNTIHRIATLKAVTLQALVYQNTSAIDLILDESTDQSHVIDEVAEIVRLTSPRDVSMLGLVETKGALPVGIVQKDARCSAAWLRHGMGREIAIGSGAEGACMQLVFVFVSLPICAIFGCFVSYRFHLTIPSQHCRQTQ
jgi:hypothetical protein